MAYSIDQLRFIYDRSSGRCHVCRKQLAFVNYGAFGRRAAWEVDHSRARCNGGTNRLSNLLPACISCNRGKGKRSARAARGLNGFKRAPLSRTARAKARGWNALAGALLGAIPGAFLGPSGAVCGAIAGAKLGYEQDPE